MINVLIADDEYWVRKSIIGKMDLIKLGAKIVGECSNGHETIDMISKLQPDIIITDMRMPEIDGVELINYLRDKSPEIKVIIISGYSDFEYTKEALKNKVEDYILKPVDEDILNECMEKTISNIHRERKERVQLKEVFLNKIICDTAMQKENIIDCCKKYNIDINYRFFSVGIINFYDNVFEDNLLEKISKIIESNLNEVNGFTFKHLNTGCQYICILKTNLDNPEVFIINTFKKTVEELNCKLSLNAKAYIGNAYNFELIHNSYIEAVESMNFIAVNKSTSIIHINSIKKSKCLYINPFNVPNEFRNMLISSIKYNKLNDIKHIVENICLTLKEHEFININNLSVFYNDLLWFIENEFNRDSITLNDLFSYDFLGNINNKHFISIDEFESEICMVFCNISNTYTKRFSNNSRTVINDIKNYIDDNYNKKLSLKEIADIFHFNEIYICKMFKNEIGINFIDYLTSVRMEKAMEYLKNSSMKISDIAYSVGYDDQRYFSKIFKKSFNLLPSEVRNIK